MEISYGWKCNFIAWYSHFHVIKYRNGVEGQRGIHGWLFWQSSHPSRTSLLPSQCWDGVYLWVCAYVYSGSILTMKFSSCVKCCTSNGRKTVVLLDLKIMPRTNKCVFWGRGKIWESFYFLIDKSNKNQMLLSTSYRCMYLTILCYLFKALT